MTAESWGLDALTQPLGRAKFLEEVWPSTLFIGAGPVERHQAILEIPELQSVEALLAATTDAVRVWPPPQSKDGHAQLTPPGEALRMYHDGWTVYLNRSEERGCYRRGCSPAGVVGIEKRRQSRPARRAHHGLELFRLHRWVRLNAGQGVGFEQIATVLPFPKDGVLRHAIGVRGCGSWRAFRGGDIAGWLLASFKRNRSLYHLK